MSKLLLGNDVGTCSKEVVVEADGKLVKFAVVEHEMSIPRPGWAEQGADAVWWVEAVKPGDLLMMIMYGSTAFFILVEDAPRSDPHLWILAGAFAGQYNLAAGMATTGALTRWFRDELARDLPKETVYTTLFAQVESITPGADVLLLLPYFSGKRTHINDKQARGLFAGLTLAHRREHLYRAVLESVAYGIRHNIETFQSISADVKRVVDHRRELWRRVIGRCGVRSAPTKQPCSLGATRFCKRT